MVAWAAGCDTPPPDEPELVREELRFGGFSFAEPAVGQIQDAIPSTPYGPCTGTLIDPQAVVTAAHCFDFMTGNLAGTFWVDVSSTRRESFAFTAVRSFGSGDGNDVAVVRLAQPVPASVAVPLRLSSSAIISMGERVTIYGYGCRRTEHDAYSGQKQRYDTLYDQTIYACPGDSGGPLIKTLPSGLRVVSKVISGMQPSRWPWEDPWPTYGYVYRHAYAIANQVDDWAGRPRGSYGVSPPGGGGGRDPRDPPIYEN